MAVTPGPWEVWIEEEFHDYELPTEKVVHGVRQVQQPGAAWDGYTVVRFDDDYGTDQVADAHLIAAAPDLLEAAKRILGEAPAYATSYALMHPDRSLAVSVREFAALEAAVKKAEGKLAEAKQEAPRSA